MRKPDQKLLHGPIPDFEILSSPERLIWSLLSSVHLARIVSDEWGNNNLPVVVVLVRFWASASQLYLGKKIIIK